MSWALQTPVSLFFYRRPAHLRQVMEKIRELRPPVLFGISDGPKTGDSQALTAVEESRRVFRQMVDWPCRWEILERQQNLGSYLSVSKGLDWVLERVGETIILEDDTVPNSSFFRFVAECLETYRENPTVGAVCGNNYDDPADWSGQTSYRFTRYHHSWGWGTWARAWHHFDREEMLLAELAAIKKENKMRLSRKEWRYWDRCFHRTYARKLDAWDYRWTLSLWKNGMVCVIPRINLVRNIGFDALGTHTLETDFAAHHMHEARSIDFPLHHPPRIGVDIEKDRKVFARHYQVLEGRRNAWQKLRDALGRLLGVKRR